MDDRYACALRALGQAEDLDLDFTARNRPALVTDLLARCSRSADAGYWWNQAVGRRTRGLLELLALTEGRERLGLTATCVQPACAELFEFELPLRGLPEADSSFVALQLGERRVRLRLPLGSDLRDWHAAGPATRAQALDLMFASLLVEGELAAGDEATVAAAVAAHDPLVDFSVSCHCPGCGEPAEVAVDLEGLALRRLARAQRALLQEVHLLASQYGWTEAEVLAVPPARRAQYRALIEEQA